MTRNDYAFMVTWWDGGGPGGASFRGFDAEHAITKARRWLRSVHPGRFFDDLKARRIFPDRTEVGVKRAIR